MFEVGEAEYVDDVAPEIAESEEHVDDVPLSHWYEYGDVPPEGFAVNITFCPESIVGDEGVTAFASNGESVE